MNPKFFRLLYLYLQSFRDRNSPDVSHILWLLKYDRFVSYKRIYPCSKNATEFHITTAIYLIRNKAFIISVVFRLFCSDCVGILSCILYFFIIFRVCAYIPLIGEFSFIFL